MKYLLLLLIALAAMAPLSTGYALQGSVRDVIVEVDEEVADEGVRKLGKSSKASKVQIF